MSSPSLSPSSTSSSTNSITNTNSNANKNVNEALLDNLNTKVSSIKVELEKAEGKLKEAKDESEKAEGKLKENPNNPIYINAVESCQDEVNLMRNACNRHRTKIQSIESEWDSFIPILYCYHS